MENGRGSIASVQKAGRASEKTKRRVAREQAREGGAGGGGCHGLDKLWKWNVGVFVYIVMNARALRAVKKLYIRLYAARDML